MRRFLFTFLTISTVSCIKPEIVQPVLYEGPLRVGENIEMFYTEKELLKSKVKAARILEFQSGDREFPEGIFIEFYNEQGKLESTLKANQAFYSKKDDRWRGVGNVEVVNTEKKEQLNSEELFWKPSTKRIFTDKFVTIRLATQVVWGTGLDAAQDFSDYTIKNVQGEMELEEENP
jgi:LPS export ABC transporter protein LptC